MPLNQKFYSVAQTLFHPGMGTENIGPLLYTLICMRRPRTVMSIGLGYSTLFLLQALSDVEVEIERDEKILSGMIDNPSRREVLLAGQRDKHEQEINYRPKLIAIDDFSDDGGRLTHLLSCIEQLKLGHLFELHRCSYQDYKITADLMPVGLVWVDCGHQMDYPDLCNRFWPVVDNEGGLFGMHYTYVDIPAPKDSEEPSLVISGPWVNAAKRQQIQAGMDAGFELLSLLEPHKHRQGSITLLRKVGDDRCRDNTLAQEQRVLYGNDGVSLKELAI